MTEERSMKTDRPVWIEWVDSKSTSGWIHPDKDLEERLECISIGFIVWEGDKSITISAAVSATGAAMEPLTIPRVAITRIQEIHWD